MFLDPDVDECLDFEVRSRCSGKCINTRGSYRCEAQKSWIFILGKSFLFKIIFLFYIKFDYLLDYKKKIVYTNNKILLKSVISRF